MEISLIGVAAETAGPTVLHEDRVLFGKKRKRIRLRISARRTSGGPPPRGGVDGLAVEGVRRFQPGLC